MRITESNLKKIITEEINKVISEEDFPTQEEFLEALTVISEASPDVLKENIQILQALINRAKNS